MLDINLIRKEPEKVRQALLKRMDDVSFDELLELDTRRRELIQETEGMKAQRNDVSGKIPRLKKAGQDVSDLLIEMKQLSAQIKDQDTQLRSINEEIQSIMDTLPCMPDKDVLPGGKENNQVVRTWGQKPEFAFEPKDHVELVTSLGLIDYERGVKLGGNGFWLYSGLGAQLEWAMLNYFIETHIANGYTFMLPPHILTWQCGYVAGQFPQFQDDVFPVGRSEDAGHFLLPTAETALINLYRDEVLKEDQLPVKCFAYTPCYRREAGSYRANERGMIRGHQFNKVEVFQYTRPEDSGDALEELTAKAEALVQGLGLHYRVSKLAARDASAHVAKTYDIEIWIPSMNEYKEVSSASNARDYQARRGNMRFKRAATKKNEYLHTLNASGLATSRLMPALVEQFQQADGSVLVPEVLRKWVGTDRLSPTGK